MKDKGKQTSIITNNLGRCYVCGTKYALQEHHCIHGVNRKKADKYGLIVNLCMKCHYDLHFVDKKLDERLQKEAQRAFESIYGHEKWMQEFHKNYLD